MTGEGLVAICRHYADHLEDIALAVSPLNVDSDNDSDADSMKSHGHLANEEEKGGLETIDEASEGAPEEAPQPRTAVEQFTNLVPNCAICNKTNMAGEECPCESERLEIAVAQAQQRAFDGRLDKIR